MTGFRKRLKRSLAGHLRGYNPDTSLEICEMKDLLPIRAFLTQVYGLVSFITGHCYFLNLVLSEMDEPRKARCGLDNESALSIQVKINDLQTCGSLIGEHSKYFLSIHERLGKHGTELMKTLADLEIVIGKDLTKMARERITLFKMTVNALLRGSNELVDLLRKESDRMILESKAESHILERMRRDMDEMRLQIQMLKDGKRASGVLNNHCGSYYVERVICSGTNISEGSCSEDDDELPYFDAFSVRQMSIRQTLASPPFISLTLLKRSHHCPLNQALCTLCQYPAATGSLRKISGAQRGAHTSTLQAVIHVFCVAHVECVMYLITETRHRRVSVPFRPQTSVNYLNMMKNCIGKDLSRIAMPVNFNEPLSALQRATEDLEYACLLHQAASLRDDHEQLAHVAAFAISAYSTMGSRSTKPFNPLLGETFEFDRSADLGWRSIAEQVSHHPPTSAMHVEGRGWTLDQSYTLTTKFKGKSLSVTPIGSTYITFEQTSNKYVYEKATTSTTVTNPLTGKLHTENHGDVTVRNVKSGDTCVLKFHQAGYFSREVPRKVTGVVYDSLGNSKFLIEAVWDKYVEIYRVTSDKLDTEYCDTDGGRRICADADKMHNFTQFAIELNEPEEGVAPSDSRRRPDQRLMEEGHWDEANAVKQRLEELQRRRKGAFEKSHPGEKYSPRWFRVRDEDTMTDRNDVYEYTNEYWQSKKEGNWGDSMAIFDL
ncbi:unnamed protein product [Toxocara canis]|uniref:Oxysterol-binding protein n=1 Tax=Toxocara canis TaxID=6265 RepID=A0A183ULF6_TOXCA|nr:unnamed protein product [Toxocara canis]